LDVARRIQPSRTKPPLEAKPQAAVRHSRSSEPKASEIVLRRDDQGLAGERCDDAVDFRLEGRPSG
jgi:hypothetical protein